MLGVVLLSEHNELVHALGNNQFRNHFAASFPPPSSQQQESRQKGEENDEIVESSAPAQRPTSSSSSSGVFSSSSACSRLEEAHEDEQHNYGYMRQQQEEGFAPQLDEDILLQQLLPLAMFCRTTHEQQQQKQFSLPTTKVTQRIESGSAGPPSNSSPGSSLHIQMALLPNSNLLAVMHEESALLSSSSSADQLFCSLRRCVHFHYGGPSFQLIPLQSGFTQLLKQRCERRMLRLLDEAIDGTTDEEGGGRRRGEKAEGRECGEDGAAPFCQNLSFGDSARHVHRTLLPLLKEMARRIATSIDRRCNCLFLHSGRLIASISSHNTGEPTATVTAFRPAELRSFLQFARQRPNPNNAREAKKGLKCHCEFGTFLHAKGLQRQKQKLTNVFVMSLSDRVEMLCLTGTEHSQLISTVWEAMELLDSPNFGDVDYNNINKTFLERCGRQILNTQKMLNTLMNGRKQSKVLHNLDLYGGGIGGVQMEGQFLEFALLEDIPRTQKLIQHHWTRFRNAFNTFVVQQNGSHSTPNQQQVQQGPPSLCHQSPASSSFQSHNSSSILSFPSFLSTSDFPATNPTSSSFDFDDSTLPTSQQFRTPSSTVSSSASTFSRNSAMSPVHLDAILAQLKKVLRALMDELLSWSAALARFRTLPLLQLAVHRTMGPQMANAMAKLDSERMSIAANIRCGQSPLRPAILGFDMLAFHFARVGTPPLSFHYVPEDAHQMNRQLIGLGEQFDEEEELEDGGEPRSNNIDEEIAFARTADGELLIQIQSGSTASDVIPKGETTRSGGTASSGLFAAVTAPLAARLGKVSRDLLGPVVSPSSVLPASPLCPAAYRCTVMFSRHTNTTLAVRQTTALMAALGAEMERNIHPNFL